MNTQAEEQAYRKGQKAAEDGGQRYANPYHCATAIAAVTWQAWYRGYDSVARAVGVVR